jgi:hypothetical protein
MENAKGDPNFISTAQWSAVPTHCAFALCSLEVLKRRASIVRNFLGYFDQTIQNRESSRVSPGSTPACFSWLNPGRSMLCNCLDLCPRTNSALPSRKQKKTLNKQLRSQQFSVIDATGLGNSLSLASFASFGAILSVFALIINGSFVSYDTDQARKWHGKTFRNSKLH